MKKLLGVLTVWAAGMVAVALYAASPQVSLVPGYQVCSIYVEHLTAQQEKEFASRIYYRRSGSKNWQVALDLVFVPPEQAARGSLVKLQENTAYDLKIEFTDRGQRAVRQLKFKTKNPVVPIARTIVLDKNNFSGKLKISARGTAAGYIRYTAAPGFVLTGHRGQREVILLDNAAYVLLDGLTIRGNGTVHGVNISRGHHIQVVNCDISDYSQIGVSRPDRDGKFFLPGSKRPLNYHSGIRVRHAQHVLIERNYIHDPQGRANSWFYSHPSGPNAVFVEHCASLALRYNDFIGNDLKRWNDAVEGGRNGHETGGFYRDGEITGNYFVLGNDDGIELDGGQMNCRMFGNKVEHTLCGVSTAACFKGPSYIFDNQFVNPGDQFRQANCALKNNLNTRRCGVGRLFFFNNTIAGRQTGVSSFLASGREGIKAVLINNIFALDQRAVFYKSVLKDPVFLSNNIFSGAGVWQKLTTPNTLYGQPNSSTAPKFINPEQGNWALPIPLEPNLKSQMIPNFLPQTAPVGATASELPYRPVKFTVDKKVVHLNLKHLTETVTLQSSAATPIKFQVQKNASANFVTVKPDSGEIPPGKKLQLSIKIAPSQLAWAKKHRTVVLVRTPQGLSRPILLTMDNRDDAKLRRQNRRKVIYACQVTPPQNGRQQVEFKIPRTGYYYMFFFDQGTAYAVDVTVDGQGAKKCRLYGEKSSTQGYWKGAISPIFPNRPWKLHKNQVLKIQVKQRGNFSYRLFHAALAEQPEELLYAPEFSK